MNKLIAFTLALACVPCLSQTSGLPSQVTGTVGNCVKIGSGNIPADNGSACSSSGNVSVFSTDKSPGVLQTSEGKAVSLTAGSTMDILPTYTGTGYVSEVFVASANYFSDLEVIVTANGEGTPSIDAKIPALTGSAFAGQGNYASKWISQNTTSSANDSSGSGVFRIPIPYSTSIHIQLKNNGAGTATVYYIVANHTGVTDNFTFTQHLYAVNYSNSGVAANAESTLANVSPGKPGVMAAVFWTYDGFPGSVTPKSAPLEGPFKIYVDGSVSPSYTSSGAEDFFGIGFYFANALAFGNQNAFGTSTLSPSNTDVVIAGITGTSSQVTWSVDRVFSTDPIAFTTGLKVTWTCGVTSAVSFTGTCSTVGTILYYTQN